MVRARSEASRALATAGVSVAMALLAWWVFSLSSRSMRLPDPASVWGAWMQLITKGYAGGTLLTHTLYSMKLALLGFVIAASSAVAIGLAMGLSPAARAIFSPIVAFIRPIPPLAWIPLAIIWFGLGDGAKLFVIWFTAFVPTMINTYAGVRGVDPTLVEAAEVHGAGAIRMLRDVYLPGAAPMIFAGLRVSLQASWMALVAAELIGAFYGLGRVLMTAAQDIYPAMILVAMLAVAASGALMTFGLSQVERRCLPWLRRS